MKNPVRMIAVAAAGVVAIAGCGSSDDASGGGATYTDPAYGYSFSYEEPFTLAPAAQLSVTLGNPTVSSTSAVTGTATPGAAVTAFNVSVYEMGGTVSDKQLGDELTKHYGNNLGIQFGKPSSVTVAGKSAVTSEGTFTPDGSKEQWRTRLYFLTDGTIEYQLTVQAPAKEWKDREGALTEMVNSFTIATHNQPVTPSPIPAPYGSFSGGNAELCNAVVDLFRAGLTVRTGRAVDNPAAVSAARELLAASADTVVTNLPSDAPSEVREALQKVKESLTETASASATPQPTASEAAIDLPETYLNKTCPGALP